MQAIRQAHTVGGARVASARPAAATRPLAPLPKSRTVCKAIELDFSDPDTQLSMAGLVLGLVFGIGAPVWYASRADRDEELLEEVRSLNRANYEATGEYLTEVSSRQKTSGDQSVHLLGPFARDGSHDNPVDAGRQRRRTPFLCVVVRRKRTSGSRSPPAAIPLKIRTPQRNPTKHRRRSPPSASPSGRTAASSWTTTKLITEVQRCAPGPSLIARASELGGRPRAAAATTSCPSTRALLSTSLSCPCNQPTNK
jgi:hypothetical protein